MLIAFLVLTTALDIAQIGALVVGVLLLLDLLRGALNGITPPTADLMLFGVAAAAGVLFNGIGHALEGWHDKAVLDFADDVHTH
ncbi:hypothetical protein RHOFW510R12_01180 [Rhodanobacter sp. FW510-R12]|uniref:hypothetical protein n=1 Tax=Rhodanobacter thiooxydans TaxID=416169 RepID=UPI000921BC4E|nr:hypothetical protein [Rhodanobacter thiooxydans]UJJ56648.1 hypothetical protein LRK53_18745 [Rhodanobacter thiooxydans]